MGFNKTSRGRIAKNAEGHVHVFTQSPKDSKKVVCACGESMPTPQYRDVPPDEQS